MTFVEVHVCPLCDNRQFAPFERAVEGDMDLAYQMCSRCGLVLQSPRMDAATLNTFYGEGYRDAVQGSETPTEKDLRIQLARAERLLSTLVPYLDEPKAFLDIGSSSGALLARFTEHYQTRGIGIELGDGYRQWSRERGLEVYDDLTSLPEEFACSFDLVSMVHVLEHIPDPVRYLQQLGQRWMTPQALLLIEVPNIFGHHAFEQSHLTAFSPRTIRQILDRAGFEVLRSITHGQPRSRLLKLYITVIARRRGEANMGRDPRYSARGVRLQRRLGSLLREFLTERLPSRTWLPLPELSHEFLEVIDRE